MSNLLILIWMLLIAFRLGLRLMLMLVGWAISKKWDLGREFLSPFECGFITLKENRLPFSIRFFVLAIIFLIFDLELIILFPGLFTLNFFSILGFSRFLFFLNFLTAGLLLEWNLSILEWIYFIRSSKSF